LIRGTYIKVDAGARRISSSDESNLVRVMPSLEEAAELVARPGSVVWRYAGDARLLGLAGYPILLQVAHPTVGAGVAEHSGFKTDPWGRLLRTLDYSYALTYGGPRMAWEVGRRVRAFHASIRGVRPDGERYHALEPAAYAWVHATLADAIVRGHQVFGCQMKRSEIDEFWIQWKRQGRLVGVREQDLPESWREFRTYFDDIVESELGDNEAVRDVLAALSDPARPPLPLLGERAWRIARLPAVHSTALATIGFLPPRLRKRFGVEWGAGDERRFRLLAAASRAATPLMPGRLRNIGPTYLRQRRVALERGDVADPARAPRPTSAAA
jgi:uncharacterized protein (DUF2236 family)